jgi:hypothetical protein
MIEVQGGQLLKLGLILVAICLNHILQELLHLRDVIDEYLDQVLDPDPLLLFQLEVLVGIRGELLLFLVLNQGADYVADEILKLIEEGRLVKIDHGERTLSLQALGLHDCFE